MGPSLKHVNARSEKSFCATARPFSKVTSSLKTRINFKNGLRIKQKQKKHDPRRTGEWAARLRRYTPSMIALTAFLIVTLRVTLRTMV